MATSVQPQGESHGGAKVTSGQFRQRALLVLASFAVATICLLILVTLGLQVRYAFYIALLAGAAVIGFFVVVRERV